MANRALDLLLAALVLGCGATAQKRSPRVRLGGYVSDKAGKPWAGARVHLRSRLIAGNEWIGEPDRIVVTSDARGRFAARILRDRDYLVWAVSEPSEHLYRATHARICVRGGPLRLHEQAEPLVQVELRVAGDDAWQHPLRAKLTGAPARLALGEQRVGDPYEVFDLELDEHGEALVPLVPWRECTVEVYDRRGVQLWVSTVALALDARKAATAQTRRREPGDIRAEPSSLTSSVVRIPEPSERKLTVLDQSGKPLADAELGQRVRGRYVPVAKTDARGSVTTRLPVRYEDHADRLYGLRGASRLVVRKSGYLEEFAEGSKNPSDRLPVLLGANGNGVLHMTQNPALAGRLVLNDETPLADAQLILYVRGMGQVPAPVLLRTDSEGRFEVTQDISQAWLLVAVLDDDVRERLSNRERAPLARVAILSAHGARKPSGTFDLSKLRRIELEVRNADGGPAGFARIDGFGFSGFNAIPPLVQLRANRRGQLALLATRCPRALLIAHDAGGYAALNWGRLQDRTTFELGGVLEVSGVVHDKNARPVRLATVALGRGFWRGPKLGFSLTMHLYHRFQAITDDAGRFSLWVPGCPDSVPLLVKPPGKRPGPDQVVDIDRKPRSDVELVIR